MDYRPAEFVRDIDPDESWEDVIADAKSLTYEEMCEHGVLELADERKVLVRGGRDGIQLELQAAPDPDTMPRLVIWINDHRHRVRRLIFHVHPRPTGPSDGDLEVLKLLGQNESMLYEIHGPVEGTMIRPKQR